MAVLRSKQARNCNLAEKKARIDSPPVEIPVNLPVQNNDAQNSDVGAKKKNTCDKAPLGGVLNLVQGVVSDLDTLLSCIINLRFGLDGSTPCSHAEIAKHLNANLKPCLKEKINDLLGQQEFSTPNVVNNMQISEQQVQALEALAERSLCRRRISQ